LNDIFEQYDRLIQGAPIKNNPLGKIHFYRATLC